MNKFIGIGIVVALLAAVGGYFYPLASAPVPQAGSATGSTFNTAKVAEITMAPLSITATTSSILNTDTSDRIVDSEFVSCATTTGQVFGSTGTAGVASWVWQFATTSVANLGLQGNTNYVGNLTVATSATDNAYTASSTNGVLGNRNRLWPAGTYLTVLTNATTTNNQTATCQAGAYYHGT